MTRESDLAHLLTMNAEDRLAPLVGLASALADRVEAGEAVEPATVRATVVALVDLLEDGVGDGQTRLALGVALGRLGDPRLRQPGDADYWATVELDGLPLEVGRYPVTVAEWRAWIDSGGYHGDAGWTEEGLAWRNSGDATWPELSKNDDNAPFLVPNQPVVGVNWHEAVAYARAHDARLPDHAERRQIVRGDGRRPYPWGEPFGHGNANTREEVLGRPCAVGLYRMDATPEGVFDLAGNVAEWANDSLGGKRVIAPGSWRQPSMAAWAKAIDHRDPDYRGTDLGLRLVREPRQ